MKILRNELVGLFACPLNYPQTSTNPAGFWEIEEIKIEIRDCKPLIWVRNEDSMWFRADQCYICEENECEEYLRIKKHKELMASLTYTYETHSCT